MAIPVITSSHEARGNVGVAFSYQIAATNSPTSFDAFELFEQLPPGLSVNRTTGLISGTPTEPTHPDTFLRIFATNASGTVADHLHLHITDADRAYITSPLTKSSNTGTPVSYQILGGGTGAPKNYSATLLPPGLSINPATGLISGTNNGISRVFLVNINLDGDSDYLQWTFTKAGTLTPIVTSSLYLICDKGVPFSHQIVCAGATKFIAGTSMPDGLTLSSTGLIQGTPLTWGGKSVIISVTNSHGTTEFGFIFFTDGLQAEPIPLIQGISALVPPSTTVPSYVWTNPEVTMVSLQMRWADVELSYGTRDFSYFTNQINQAISNGKKILLRVLVGGGPSTTGGDAPPWVFTAMGVDPASHTIVPGTTYTYDDPDDGHVVTMAVPWHPTWMGYRRALSRALRDYVLSLTDAQRAVIQVVACSGVGSRAGSDEWYFPHSTDVVGTGGPTGSGYVLSESDRWLHATDAVNPGAGYSTDKMEFITTGATDVPEYDGAIMLDANTVFHPTANFNVTDIGIQILGTLIPIFARIVATPTAQTATIDKTATVLGKPFPMGIPERGYSVAKEIYYLLTKNVVMESGPMGDVLDATASGGYDTTNYLALKLLANVDFGKPFAIAKPVSTQIPKAADAGLSDWHPLVLANQNRIPVGGRNIAAVWGDTSDTGGSGYKMNGGDGDDPDGIVPNPPGLNAPLILRRAAEHLATYGASYEEIWLADIQNQDPATLDYISSLLHGGANFYPLPPVITSPLVAGGETGATIVYQIRATGNPFFYDFLPESSVGYNIESINSSTGTVTLRLLTPGIYSVELRASSTFGSGFATLVLTVTEQTLSHPHASFGFEMDPINGLIVNFTDASTDDGGGIIASWIWNFGDGGGPDLRINPSHTYLDPGSYDVTLLVTDNNGASDSITITIDVATEGGGGEPPPPPPPPSPPGGSISVAPIDSTLRSNLKAACKLRYVPKQPEQLMTIRNLDAMRLACDAILKEQAGQWAEANASMARAEEILQNELKEYLSGIEPAVPFVSDDSFGMSELGGVL